MRTTHGSIRQHKFLGLLVVAIALASGQGAAADPARVQTLLPSKAVSLKGLDLTNERDLQTLHARVQSAAILVCQDLMLTGATPRGPIENKQCIRDTYTTSIDRIGQSLATINPATAERLVAGKLFASTASK